MCQQFSDLRCKEVINVCDGARLGYVYDLDLDPECGKILSIIVPGRCRLFGLLQSGEDYVIPWHCIRRVGADIILVDVVLEDVCRPRQKKGLIH